jgi:hypothetical protein
MHACRSLVDLLVILNLTLPRRNLTQPKQNATKTMAARMNSGHAQLVTGPGPWTEIILQRHAGVLISLGKNGIGMIVISQCKCEATLAVFTSSHYIFSAQGPSY